MTISHFSQVNLLKPNLVTQSVLGCGLLVTTSLCNLWSADEDGFMFRQSMTDQRSSAWVGIPTYEVNAGEMVFDIADWSLAGGIRHDFAFDPVSNDGAWGMHWGLGGTYFGWGQSEDDFELSIHQLTARYHLGFHRFFGESSIFRFSPFLGAGAGYWDLTSSPFDFDESELTGVVEAGVFTSYTFAPSDSFQMALGLEYNARFWDIKHVDLEQHLLTPYASFGFAF